VPRLLRPRTPLGERGAPRVPRSPAVVNALIAVGLAPRCASCAVPLDEPLAGSVCRRCWTDAYASGGAYDGALRDIIHAFKYEGRRSLARPLAAFMRAERPDVLAGADCAVPVPLHPWRRIRRGFNQAADLARHLDVPVLHALWRVRATSAQAGLSADGRQQNVRGAFRLSPLLTQRVRERSIEARIVVLVDDVKTTGATLDACAEVLREAGAREVRALTIARAILRAGA
jgi:ComF family protein